MIIFFQKNIVRRHGAIALFKAFLMYFKLFNYQSVGFHHLLQALLHTREEKSLLSKALPKRAFIQLY